MPVGLEEILALALCLMIKHSGPAISYPDLVPPALQSHTIPISHYYWLLHTNFNYADVESYLRRLFQPDRSCLLFVCF